MSILIKPIVTEKASLITEKENNYTFLVSKSANKIEIKKKIEEVYGVTVEKVRTLNIAVIRKTRHTKKGIQQMRKGASKKAIIKLKEGDVIDVYNKL